ncbi:protein NETWORKED 1A-like [Dorcoceras hygrometricum]|uniref:Protein NETWORKED 1A-like n=1 Tax=Dorcoceras hygrometricum TaxID=472368 RepID=A0A2Z7AMV9_9LAMI|nr:protein NETWORKED 1A-like [Dorcoceras hygrometricum]
MVKRLATSPHDPLGITDSACKNQSVVVSVQYGPFNPYIPIRSTTIGKSRVAIDPIAMHTSWRSNSDITSVTSIGYPRMSASGESSTTMHRLLHASGSHPIPTPYDPKTMILVDGLWTVELCADKWVKIPRKVISTEVPRQRQFDDTLPSMSVFFRLMKKRWADVCLEVTDFCAYQRLLPVGSINFCRALEIVETDSCFASRQPTVFSLRLSQFCTIHLQYSLFSSLSTADISDFLSSIALDRTAFRSVQIAQSVVPSVQLSLDQRPSSPISPGSSSSLRFDQRDIDATASSRPPISQDLSASFADLQANLLEQIFEYQSGLSSKLHKIEQSVCDSLRDQADIFRNLYQGARQEFRTLDDVQSLRFNEFRKTVLAQNASIFQGLADVRQEVQAVNAKVDIMASRLNAIKKDAEATKEALSHQLLEFHSSTQENHNVIHAQLSELVDYIHRGSADKKGESGSRGLQQPANTQIEGSAVTPSFAQRVEMAQRRIVHTVIDADRDTAERDRERRRKEARALKRRRKD